LWPISNPKIFHYDRPFRLDTTAIAGAFVFGLIASTLGGYVGEDVRAARWRAAE